MDAQPTPPVRVAKHDTVATLFADGLFGGSVTSGVVRLDLFADHFDPGAGGMQPTIVGRLIMPAEKLEGFARALGDLAQRLQAERKSKDKA